MLENVLLALYGRLSLVCSRMCCISTCSAYGDNFFTRPSACQVLPTVSLKPACITSRRATRVVFLSLNTMVHAIDTFAGSAE